MRQLCGGGFGGITRARQRNRHLIADASGARRHHHYRIGEDDGFFAEAMKGGKANEAYAFGFWNNHAADSKAGREIDVVITKGVRIDVPMTASATPPSRPTHISQSPERFPETRYLEVPDDGNY